MEVKDAWRKAKEEDQVMYDCYLISSNQLILLLSFQCLAVNTQPLVAAPLLLHLFLAHNGLQYILFYKM